MRYKLWDKPYIKMNKKELFHLLHEWMILQYKLRQEIKSVKNIEELKNIMDKRKNPFIVPGCYTGITQEDINSYFAEYCEWAGSPFSGPIDSCGYNRIKRGKPKWYKKK